MLQPTFFPTDKSATADRSAPEPAQVFRFGSADPAGPRVFLSILDRLSPRSHAVPERRPPVAAEKEPARARVPSGSDTRVTRALPSSRVRDAAPLRERVTEDAEPSRPEHAPATDRLHDAEERDAQDTSRETADTSQADASDAMAAWYLSFTVSLGGEPLVQAVSVHQSSSAEDLSVPTVDGGLYLAIDAAPLLQVMAEPTTAAPVQLDAPRLMAGDGSVHPVDLLDGEGSNQPVVPAMDLEQAVQQSVEQATTDPQGQANPADPQVGELLRGLEAVADQPLTPAEGDMSAVKTTLAALSRAEDSGERHMSAALREGVRSGEAAQPSLVQELPPTGSQDSLGFDPSGTQQFANEFFQFADGQGSAREQLGEQGAGQRPGAAVPASGRLGGETGFGDAIAGQQAGDRGLSDGGGLRSAATGQAGRSGFSPAWPTGTERTPLIQAVSLDLEPADLGPLNVRIFMMDRTVHAHIRTEHADLGQGMLAQQHQLEVKLQHSGLEMGELRVTVDQQQLTRDDAQGWLRQQSEGRSVVDQAETGGVEQEDRNGTVVQPRRSGLMSLFA